MRIGSPLIFALVAAPALALAQTADVKKPEAAEKKAKASIYDAKADARLAVEEATAVARRDAKRILVMFGGDWCGWCHKLHALFKSDKDIRGTLSDEYVLVMVDTKAPNAESLLDECKGDLKSVGYPFLAVLGGDGKVVTRQETDALEEGDHHDPKKVRAFLDKWVAPKASAEAVMADALARAKSEDKLVFLHFGAPWCGWCHKLEEYLARPDVAAILGKEFVDLKIDPDRMIGGKDVIVRFGAEQKGVPWLAFLDPDGKTLATSDGPEGNIGYPAKPEEIAYFVGMLRKTSRKLKPADIDAIESSLKDAAKPILESLNRPRP